MDRSAAETFDPRLTPARPDLAAAHLRGQVFAARFVEGEVREVIEPQAPLRRIPSPDTPLDSEVLKGERVTIYETTDEGWAWGQIEDGYVGWMPANALVRLGAAPTHKVRALRTLMFPGPSIKLPPLEMLSLGSKLSIARMEPPFAVTTGSAYVPLVHLAPVAASEPDFVAVAQRFEGVPYLWGGKTSLGLDCSGLVQVALAAAGVACPRDSDMQEHALGSPVDPCDTASFTRGDLLFWSGHVGIMRDGNTLLHANAFHMAVAVEPLAEALTRISAGGGSELRTVRRLTAPPRPLAQSPD
jgi:cell wall-associated NlpC family hydrolase